MPWVARSRLRLHGPSPMRALPLGLMLAALPLAPWAAEVTLLYQATNQWVAEADNTALRKLLNAAKSGVTEYTVILPHGNRPLSQARLAVLIDLLAKQRQDSALTLTETRGKTAPNTLRVRW